MFGLTRYRPKSVSSFSEEMDRLFENFLSRSFRESDNGDWGGFALDLYEEEDAYTLKADLPGVSKDDIDVEINKNTLNISGERKLEEEREGEQHYYFERRYGKFARSIQLPASVDPEQVEANFKDGVLTINLPKTEAEKPKKVSVL